ncbi:hypothetical protein [Shewanella sp. MBTL60-007]|uniref:hypothetical protein n=1 Tax=Shewanella sp. MBTL60-007 TaxID=2815911 RepID=UPI001BB8D5B0|nr:hypothetical protein [Shewanella sp. MBTL60-007]GIU15137.1 hypothetical protein TUM3792_06930 [Shewanella sp. MBTL60-007]
MSSPLGGFYISSLNRGKQAKFDLSHRIRVQLNISLAFIEKTNDRHLLLNESRSFYVGETQTFTANSCNIDLDSGFIGSEGATPCHSSLLSLNCRVNAKLNGNVLSGLQEINLCPNEPVTSLVNGNERLRLTLLAKPV